MTAGDLDRRIGLEGKTGVFEALSRGINELVENVDVLAREIQSLVSVANRGDLTRRIQTDGKAGLLSRLGSGINELTANMAGVVSQVKDAAAEVYRGVEEISAGNSNLSKRTDLYITYADYKGEKSISEGSLPVANSDPFNATQFTVGVNHRF